MTPEERENEVVPALEARIDRLTAVLREVLPIAEMEYPNTDFRKSLHPGDLPEDFDPPFWETVGLPNPEE